MRVCIQLLNFFFDIQLLKISVTSEAFRKFSEILLSRAFLISAPRLSHKAVFDKRCNIKRHLNTCFPKLPEKKFLAFNDAFRRCFIETTRRSRLTIVKCVRCRRERKLFFSFDQRCAIKIFLLTEEEGFAKTLVTLETSFCRLFGNSSLSY